MDTESLKEALDKVVRDCDAAHRVANDPVEFPRKFTKPADMEVAAFVASALAYGQVKLFKPVIGRILDLSEGGPADFVRGFDPKKDRRSVDGIYYRLGTSDDIAALLYVLGEILRRHGSLKSVFLSGYQPWDETVGPALSRFSQTLLSIDTTPVYGRDIRPRGLTHSFPSPADGSPCKRLCMFLRWMVRPDDGVDLGLWPEIPTSKLVIPLDTHIARISRLLDLTRRANPSWRTAVDITNRLRLIDPADPIRYDFALAHLGISGECPTTVDADKCARCGLLPLCINVEAV